MKREKENQYNKIMASAILCSLIFILITSVVYTPTINGQLLAEESTEIGGIESQGKVPNVLFEENRIFIGIWLINIYGFDYSTSNYVFDMFVFFYWNNTNITNIDWFLMNGYPVNPASKVLVDKNLSGEVRYEVYRTRATLSGVPDASDFPFDSIKLPVYVELFNNESEGLRLTWLENETGIDPGFSNAGWETTNIELYASIHDYPLDTHLPRVEMILTQQRNQPAAVIENLFPLFVFGFISGCSFLFVLSEKEAVGLRLGLNTSMLVTTLLFNFAISPSIPPSSTFIIYGLIVYSILLFIIVNLLVTTMGFVSWYYYKNEKRIKSINRQGLLISLIVPTLFFIILFLVRS